MAKNFPSSHARKIADEAVDALPVSEPMSVFLDTWVRAYIEAGGKTPFKFD
jgi:hypothetical protein